MSWITILFCLVGRMEVARDSHLCLVERMEEWMIVSLFKLQNEREH